MAKMIFENNQWLLSDVWGIDDVRNTIECNNIEEAEDFTDEDCVRVLELAVRAFDANYGITWNTIDVAVHQRLGEKA